MGEKVTDVVLIVIVATPDVPSANIPISSIPSVSPIKVTDLPVAAVVVPTLPIVVVTVIDSREGSPAAVFWVTRITADATVAEGVTTAVTTSSTVTVL